MAATVHAGIFVAVILMRMLTPSLTDDNLAVDSTTSQSQSQEPTLPTTPILTTNPDHQEEDGDQTFNQQQDTNNGMENMNPNRTPLSVQKDAKDKVKLQDLDTNHQLGELVRDIFQNILPTVRHTANEDSMIVSRASSLNGFQTEDEDDDFADESADDDENDNQKVDAVAPNTGTITITTKPTLTSILVEKETVATVVPKRVPPDVGESVNSDEDDDSAKLITGVSNTNVHGVENDDSEENDEIIRITPPTTATDENDSEESEEDTTQFLPDGSIYLNDDSIDDTSDDNDDDKDNGGILVTTTATNGDDDDSLDVDDENESEETDDSDSDEEDDAGLTTPSIITTTISTAAPSNKEQHDEDSDENEDNDDSTESEDDEDVDDDSEDDDSDDDDTVTTDAPVPHTTAIPGLCDGCDFKHGVGYKPHPSDCTLFLQCRLDKNGHPELAGVHPCPHGLYWSQDKLTCDYQANVRCVDDVCQGKRKTKRSDASCRGYWDCISGTAVAMCCARGFAYNPVTARCHYHPHCQEDCQDSSHTERIKECQGMRAVAGDRTVYEVKTGSSWTRMPCPPTLGFTTSPCGCTLSLSDAAPQPAEPECVPELYLPFDTDTKDSSGRHVWVENNGVVIQHGKAFFDGNSRLQINRFSNAPWGSTVYVSLRYKSLAHLSSAGVRQALVSNGDCQVRPSVALCAGPRGVDFYAETRGSGMPANFTVPYGLSKGEGWHEVLFKLDDGHLHGFVNNQRSQAVAKGALETRKRALVVGSGAGCEDFHGFIDELVVYLCHPFFKK